MIREIKLSILCGLALMALMYTAMFLNTSELVRYAQSVYRGEIEAEQLQNTQLEAFNITKTNPDIEQVDIKIKRIFVLHNFFNGAMWVKTECEAVDSNGEVTYGDYSYEKWIIEKTENGWQIVDIKSKTGGKLF